MKKAQGISMNVIIIAAIALIVLVVLSVIFIGRMGTFRVRSEDCAANGGVCVDPTLECPYPKTTSTAYQCLEIEGNTPRKTGEKCCI